MRAVLRPSDTDLPAGAGGCLFVCVCVYVARLTGG